MMTSLSLGDLVRSEGYAFKVTQAPWQEPRVLGAPPDPDLFSALMCEDAAGNPYVACMADCLDHVYSASHEIAEHQTGFVHTEATWSLQANILSRWVRAG